MDYFGPSNFHISTAVEMCYYLFIVKRIYRYICIYIYIYIKIMYRINENNV